MRHPLERRSSSATRTGRSRCRSSKARTDGDSTPPPARKKCWRAGSDATSWKRSRPSRAYVTAQRRYAQEGHDGKPAGVHATKFQSDPGKQNGLYWPTARGEKRSPLGDLVAQAAEEGRTLGVDRTQPTPLSWLLLQDPDRPGSGGTRQSEELSRQGRDVWWIRTSRMAGSGRRDRCHDLHRQSGRHRAGTGLGPQTDAIARKMTVYNPDKSWRPVQ